MNTAAPHALKKRLLTLALSLAFLLTCLPAALAVDLNADAGFYFKQSRGGTCTLASAAMMLRRRAYFDGLSDWTNVTENSVRSTAWANGLAHSFTYKEMQVGYATLPSGLQSKTAVLISLLEQHPEGAAGGQLQLYGAGDRLYGREPVLCLGLHGVRQRKQHPDLLVGQGCRGHQAAADGPADGDHGRNCC